MDAIVTTTEMPSQMPTSVAGMHSEMQKAMGGCRISMLWNWNVQDACFISTSWHITSKAMFAGSCIGVVCLVVVLESLRRAVKEYDRLLIGRRVAAMDPDSASSGKPVAMAPFRPTFVEQAVRALLHVLQFAVAYFVMLLAMYYNGYIIISIFIGAYLGSFLFHWEQIGPGGQQTSAAKEATICCG